VIVPIVSKTKKAKKVSPPAVIEQISFVYKKKKNGKKDKKKWHPTEVDLSADRQTRYKDRVDYFGSSPQPKKKYSKKKKNLKLTIVTSAPVMMDTPKKVVSPVDSLTGEKVKRLSLVCSNCQDGTQKILTESPSAMGKQMLCSRCMMKVELPIPFMGDSIIEMLGEPSWGLDMCFEGGPSVLM